MMSAHCRFGRQRGVDQQKKSMKQFDAIDFRRSPTRQRLWCLSSSTISSFIRSF